MSELTTMEQAVVLLLHDYRKRKAKSQKRTFRAERLIAKITGVDAIKGETPPETAGECATGAFEDSREEIEMDVRQTFEGNPMVDSYAVDHLCARVDFWLDRMAAITEREWTARWMSHEITNAELKSDMLEMGDQLTDMENQRDEWKTKCETREVAYKQADAERKRYSEQISELQAKLDDMERTYMRLPVDADGVPIRIGDYLQGVYSKFEVCAVSEHYAYWAEGKHFDEADCCRHVQQDAVESLLDQFWRETDGIVFPSDKDGLLEKKKAEYAERIRRACNG